MNTETEPKPAKRKRGPRTRTVNAIEAVQEGVCEIVDLAGEMRDWYDALPDSLQMTDKGERVDEAAQALEDSDIERIGDTFDAALSAIVDGVPEVVACPEHAEGERCPRCGWSGKSHTAQRTPLREYTYGETISERFGGRQMYIATKGNGTWSVSADATEAEFTTELQRIRENHQRDLERADRIDALYRLGANQRIAHEPALEPVDEMEATFDALTVTLPVGRKRQSRAQRLAHAINRVVVGANALRVACEDRKDKRFETLIETLIELIDATDEVAEVEFPGMYG